MCTLPYLLALLLVRGDPTEDIRATRAIVGVWKLGVRADREAWRSARRRVEAERWPTAASIAPGEALPAGVGGSAEADGRAARLLGAVVVIT